MLVAELDFEVRKVKPFKSGKGAFLSGLILADVPERSGIWARYKTFGVEAGGVRRVPDLQSVIRFRRVYVNSTSFKGRDGKNIYNTVVETVSSSSVEVIRGGMLALAAGGNGGGLDPAEDELDSLPF